MPECGRLRACCGYVPRGVVVGGCRATRDPVGARGLHSMNGKITESPNSAGCPAPRDPNGHGGTGDCVH